MARFRAVELISGIAPLYLAASRLYFWISVMTPLKASSLPRASLAFA